MLQQLTISNYALINQLELSPINGMIVITGETGAGKSIILGALGLLMGNRADTKVLFNTDRKCMVEGEFHPPALPILKKLLEANDLDEEPRLTIRREISSSGKSRAFVNDTPVNLSVMKEIASQVIDIHSQHETLLLGSSNYQMEVLDVYAGNDDLRLRYAEAYHIWKKAKQQLTDFQENNRKQQEELDYNTFLRKEFDDIQIHSQEEFQQLEEELNTSENAEIIKLKLSEAEQLLEGSDLSIVMQLDELRRILSSIQQFSKELEELAERIASVRLEISDVASELERKAAHIEYDSARIEWLRTQLDAINGLFHKHRVDDFDALLKIKEGLQARIDEAENADHHLEALKKQESTAKQQAQQCADELSISRKDISTIFIHQLREQLAELGMPNAQMKVAMEKVEMTSYGSDEVTFLFSANKGIAPEKLQKVASGGEFSRLMFAVKYLLAQKTNLPTLIFDEIDSGISGEIAIKMGRMMKKMSNGHQIISITHLPQVAALGEEHYKVVKEEENDMIVTTVHRLSNDDRELEIAKMISGDNPSDVAFKNARELLSLGTF